MATALGSFLHLGKPSGQGATRPTRPAGAEAELTRGGAHRSGDPAPGLSRWFPPPARPPRAGPEAGAARPASPAHSSRATARARQGTDDAAGPRRPPGPPPPDGEGTAAQKRAGPAVGEGPREERPRLRGARAEPRGFESGPGAAAGAEPGVAAARSAGWSSLGGNFKPEFKTRKLVQALELDCRVSWATSRRPRRGGQTQGEALQRLALIEGLKKLGRNCGHRRPVVGRVTQLVRGVCTPHPQHTPNTPLHTITDSKFCSAGPSDWPISDRQLSSKFSSKFIFTSCLPCELRREGVFHRLATP